MKGEKLQSKLPAQGEPQSSGFRRHILEGENPKPSFGFVSSSLSSLLPPTPSLLLWVCCGEEKGRRARTNTNKSCCQLLHSLGSHHWLPTYYLPLLWFRITHLSLIYLPFLGPLWTLSSSRFPRPQDRPVDQSFASSCCSWFSWFLVSWFLDFWVLRFLVSSPILQNLVVKFLVYAVWGLWTKGFRRRPSCNTRSPLSILPLIPSILWGILPLKEKGECMFRYFCSWFLLFVFHDCFPYYCSW